MQCMCFSPAVMIPLAGLPASLCFYPEDLVSAGSLSPVPQRHVALHPPFWHWSLWAGRKKGKKKNNQRLHLICKPPVSNTESLKNDLKKFKTI